MRLLVNKGVEKMNENYLKHYGILGMKWGVRKASTKQKNTKHTIKRKNEVKSLSNEEIKKRIDRLLLEKQYTQLKNEMSNSRNNKNKDFAKSIIEASGKNIATQLTTYAMGTAVNKVAGKEIVNPKKGQKDK